MLYFPLLWAVTYAVCYSSIKVTYYTSYVSSSCISTTLQCTGVKEEEVDEIEDILSYIFTRVSLIQHKSRSKSNYRQIYQHFSFLTEIDFLKKEVNIADILYWFFNILGCYFRIFLIIDVGLTADILCQIILYLRNIKIY